MSDLGLRAITNTGVGRMSVSRMSSEFKRPHRPSRRFSKVAGEPRSQSKACDSARTSLPNPLIVLTLDVPGFILVSRYRDVNLGIELLTLTQAGAGFPGCSVRACAQQREVTACPLCPDFPCDRLAMLNHYPLLVADGKRMRQLGLEKWVAEQEAREAAGFAYADVRYE